MRIVILFLFTVVLGSKIGRLEQRLVEAKEAEACRAKLQHEVDSAFEKLKKSQGLHQLRCLKKKRCPRGGNVTRLTEKLHRAAESEAIKLGLPAQVYETTIVEPDKGPADSVMVILHSAIDAKERPTIVLAGLKPFLRSTRFIIPQAPGGFLTAFNETGPSWYNIFTVDLSVDPEKAVNVTELFEAVENVKVIIEKQVKIYGIERGRILLYGISQGASLGNTVYLQSAVGGVVSSSGFLPLFNRYPELQVLDGADAPALLFHGTADDDVPFQASKILGNTLDLLGRKWELIVFKGSGHDLTIENRKKIITKSSKFFQKILGIGY